MKKSTTAKVSKGVGRARHKNTGRSTAPVPSPKKAQGTPPPPSRAGVQAKAERRTIYRKMLREATSGRFVEGLCILLAIFTAKSIRTFPELWVQRPRNAAVYWWDFGDKEPRIKALKIAIKASAPTSRPLPTRDSDRKGAKRSPSSATEPLKSAGRSAAKASPKTKLK